jgi:hypothetical protein
MREQMNRIVIFIYFFASSYSICQDTARRPIQLSTQFDLSFIHLGSYGKERSIIYLEQSLDYQFDNGIEIGGSFGINAYPALLALPIGAQVRIPLFPNSLRNWVLSQSIHKNLPVGDIFYNGNRYRGGFSMTVYEKDKIHISPELGYSFVWDRYGGMALSFLGGIRVSY